MKGLSNSNRDGENIVHIQISSGHMEDISIRNLIFIVILTISEAAGKHNMTMWMYTVTGALKS
jgi:hypothetical protein